MNKGKSLFDSENFDENEEFNESINEYVDDYSENEVQSSLNSDKIFGNTFNSGDTEFEVFGKLKIHGDYNTFDSEFTDNSYESYEKHELQKEIYTIFIESPFFEKYSKIKQVPKNDMAKIYYYFADPIRKKNRFTIIDIFIEIANFMNLNYKEMFHNLLPLDKQLIIQELDNTYGILKKRKIKKLF
jgi:hypothetical protein